MQKQKRNAKNIHYIILHFLHSTLRSNRKVPIHTHPLKSFSQPFHSFPFNGFETTFTNGRDVRYRSYFLWLLIVTLSYFIFQDLSEYSIVAEKSRSKELSVNQALLCH